jgi:hypothetical protein
MGTSHTLERRSRMGIRFASPSAATQRLAANSDAAGKYRLRTAIRSQTEAMRPRKAKIGQARVSLRYCPVTRWKGRKRSRTGAGPK